MKPFVPCVLFFFGVDGGKKVVYFVVCGCVRVPVMPECEKKDSWKLSDNTSKAIGVSVKS